MRANRTRSSSHRREGGQSLIEFALMFPFIMVFLAAIIIFGLAMHTRSNLQQAMREGARQAAVGKPLADVQDIAAGNTGGDLDPSDVGWCLPAGSSGEVGDAIQVHIIGGHDFQLVSAGGIFAFWGMEDLVINMDPKATARLEQEADPSVLAC